MSNNLPINTSDITAPTPQNTPLNTAPIAQASLSRPTVPAITEDDEDDDGDDGDDAPGAGAVHKALLGLVHGRLATLIGKSSGYIESLPEPVKRTVEALKGVQVEYDKLQNEFKHEVYELEKKYLLKYQPLFDRRATLISGKDAPTQDEIAAGEKETTKDNDEYTPLPAVDKPEAAAIDDFWLTALRNHLGISDLITDRDAAALKHLVDVTFTYTNPPEQRGFTLFFHFSPNEFFENKVLTKKYLYKEEVGYGGDFIYDRSKGDTIKWKEDKDLTKEIEIKKQRNKNTNRTRVIRQSRPADSFFNFFSPPEPPSEDIDEDEVDEDELGDLEERLELDYQIGEDLKDRVIPRAVDYFTGKALEYDSLDDMDDDDDEEDYSDDEDRFEEDPSDDDDEPAPPKRVSKKGGDKQPTSEECKTQ